MVFILLVFNLLQAIIEGLHVADPLQLSVTAMQAASTIAANLLTMA
jgi:hypothetical protein